MAEYSVPAGCPMHFVTAAEVMPSQVMVNGGSSTATLVDTQVVQLDTVDVFSCSCDHVTQGVTFQRFAVTSQGLQAGDYASIDWVGYSGPVGSIAITAAGACPTVEWPTDYQAAIACDRCPVDPIGSDSGSGSGSGGGNGHGGGCAAGGTSSVAAALALLALRRRRMLRA